MTALAPHVETWAVSREKLACTLKRFREQGAAAGPLTFGAHRKPEGGGAGCGPSERSSTSRNNANFVGKTPTKPNVITEKFRIITGMPTSEKVPSSLSSHIDERSEGTAARARPRGGREHPQEPQWGSAGARERSDRSKGPASAARPGEETEREERSESRNVDEGVLAMPTPKQV